MRGRGGNGWIVLMMTMTLSDNDDERGGITVPFLFNPTIYPFNAGVGEMRGVCFDFFSAVHLDSSISRHNLDGGCIVIVALDLFSSSPLTSTDSRRWSTPHAIHILIHTNSLWQSMADS